MVSEKSGGTFAQTHPVIPLQMHLAAVLGWFEWEQRDVIASCAENRALKSQLAGRRLQLDDAQRQRLAVLGQRFGRGVLREVATLVTPDTIPCLATVPRCDSSQPLFADRRRKRCRKMYLMRFQRVGRPNESVRTAF